jgi:hypothetical protein
MNYKRDLEIDLNCLPMECRLQPSLFMQYSELSVDACLERDRLKEILDATDAVIDSEVRCNPTLHGWTGDKKPTETFISNAVKLDGRHIKATQNYHNALKQSKLLEAAVKAFAQRKDMLGYEVNMLLGGIFSDIKDNTIKKSLSQTNERQRDVLNKNRG